MATTWHYERLEDGANLRHAPANDMDGKITGHIVYGLKAWFDEHPEERKRLGWTKHIHPDIKAVEHNPQSQYIATSIAQVDEYTVTDVYYVMDKSEEQMRLEETLNFDSERAGGVVFYGGEFDEL